MGWGVERQPPVWCSEIQNSELQDSELLNEPPLKEVAPQNTNRDPGCPPRGTPPKENPMSPYTEPRRTGQARFKQMQSRFNMHGRFLVCSGHFNNWGKHNPRKKHFIRPCFVRESVIKNVTVCISVELRLFLAPQKVSDCRHPWDGTQATH